MKDNGQQSQIKFDYDKSVIIENLNENRQDTLTSNHDEVSIKDNNKNLPPN